MPTTAQRSAITLPSRTQTRFCCRHGPEVACATRAVARCRPMIRLRRLADADRARPPSSGWRASAPPDGLTRTSRAEAERVAQDQLLVRERARAARRRRRFAVPTPAFSPASSRRRARRVRSRAPRACGSMRWSMPRIQAGRSQTLRARSPAASTTAAAPSVIGGQSCLRSGDDERSGSASSFSTSKSPRDLRVRVRLARRAGCARRPRPARARCAPASRAARAPAARRAITASGQSGARSRDRAAASSTSGRSPSDDLPKRVDQRRVDVAGLDLHPRLVERPGAVHLDVRLGDRRPGADGVERDHERERLARRGSRCEPEQVKSMWPASMPERATASCTTGIRISTSLRQLAPRVGRLREGDDGDVAHHRSSL